MRIELEGGKFEKIGDLKPSEQLMELVKEEGKKIKLELPFSADGFKSEKTPLQPDGKTPIVVKEAGLISEKTKPKETTKKAEKSYTKQELEEMEFNELKEIAKKLGQTGRSKKGLIKDILKSQK